MNAKDEIKLLKTFLTFLLLVLISVCILVTIKQYAEVIDGEIAVTQRKEPGK